MEDPETGGGLGAFLSSAPRVIGSITALIGAVTGLLIALNKTGVIGGDGDDGGSTIPTETVEANSIFEPLDRPPIGRVYFDGNGKTMYVRATKPNNPLVHLAKQEDELTHSR